MLENLKNEMEKQGIRVKDIANLLNLKSPAVSKRIYGNVQMNEKEKDKIAKFLNVSNKDFLFKDTGFTPLKKEYKKTVFSDRFTKALEIDGRTQKEIAKLLNVNERTISDWKNGKQSTNLKTLKKISELLNVSLSYLSGESDLYPSSVNYLDENIKEYRKITGNLKKAVNDYLANCNFDVKKLEKLENLKSDPNALYEWFNNEHKEEYRHLTELEIEIGVLELKLANDLGFCVNDIIDLSDEEYELVLNKSDEHLTSKRKEYYDLENKIDNSRCEYYKKINDQSHKISDFYHHIQNMILVTIKNDLSDIITEHNIFNQDTKFKDNCYLMTSYFNKKLYELNELYNDINSMNEEQFNNSIEIIGRYSDTKTYRFNHRFGIELSTFFKDSIKDKKSTLKYLRNEIDEVMNTIKNLEDNHNK